MEDLSRLFNFHHPIMRFLQGIISCCRHFLEYLFLYIECHLILISISHSFHFFWHEILHAHNKIQLENHHLKNNWCSLHIRACSSVFHILLNLQYSLYKMPYPFLNKTWGKRVPFIELFRYKIYSLTVVLILCYTIPITRSLHCNKRKLWFQSFQQFGPSQLAKLLPCFSL